MDGTYWVMVVGICGVVLLDAIALLKGIDGAFFGISISAIVGIVEFLRYAKAKRRRR